MGRAVWGGVWARRFRILAIEPWLGASNTWPEIRVSTTVPYFEILESSVANREQMTGRILLQFSVNGGTKIVKNYPNSPSLEFFSFCIQYSLRFDAFEPRSVSSPPAAAG